MQLAVFYNHVVCAAKQKNVSTEEILNQIKKAGITGLEFSIDEIREQESELSLLMKKTGFFVSCIYSRHDFSFSANGAKAFSLIDTAARLGSSKVLIIPGFCSFTSKKPVFWKDNHPNLLQYFQMNQMAKALTMICNYAANKNITVTLEDFDDKRAPYCTMNGLLWFMKKVPALKYTFDSGNFQYCGEDEINAFQLLKNYISHVHLKDRTYDVGNQGDFSLDLLNQPMYPSPVGYGCIHMKEILSLLHSIKYEDYLTIEHFGAIDQLNYMELSSKWILSQVTGVKAND